MIRRAVLVLTLPLMLGMYAAMAVGLILGAKLDDELGEEGRWGWVE